MLFVEAPETEAEIEAVAGGVPGRAAACSTGSSGGKTPRPAARRVRELGFALVIFPVTTLFAAGQAVADALGADPRDDGTPAGLDVPAFEDFRT